MPTDNFNNTTGTSLPAHNASWVTPTGATGMEIRNNTACGSGSVCANYWNATFADAHYSKAVTAAAIDISAGVAVRVQSGAASWFFATYDPGADLVFAGQCLSGSPTDWDSGQGGWNPGDSVELRIDPDTPTTVYLYRGATLVQTYTGKNALSGGRPGVAAFNGLGTGIDSWEGDDVTVEPPISDQPETLHVIRSGIRLR